MNFEEVLTISLTCIVSNEKPVAIFIILVCLAYSVLEKDMATQPTPVFLLGESQGRGSLVGFCLWGCTELDRTEAT